MSTSNTDPQDIARLYLSQLDVLSNYRSECQSAREELRSLEGAADTLCIHLHNLGLDMHDDNGATYRQYAEVELKLQQTQQKIVDKRAEMQTLADNMSRIKYDCNKMRNTIINNGIKKRLLQDAK